MCFAAIAWVAFGRRVTPPYTPLHTLFHSLHTHTHTHNVRLYLQIFTFHSRPCARNFQMKYLTFSLKSQQKVTQTDCDVSAAQRSAAQSTLVAELHSQATPYYLTSPPPPLGNVH